MSDKINRLIQQANIDKERAERLLEEIQLMDEQIDRLTRELAEARDKALEEAANVADEITDELFGRSGELAACRIASRVRALKEKPRP